MSQGRKDLVDKMLHGRGVQVEMLLGRCIEDFTSWLPSSLINYLIICCNRKTIPGLGHGYGHISSEADLVSYLSK
jgi:hypothetical protein